MIRWRFKFCAQQLSAALTKNETRCISQHVDHASVNKRINNGFGGEQSRPNVHIDDITEAYIHLLKNNKLTGIFNVGFENLKIIEIAEMIASKTGAKISVSSQRPKIIQS